MKIGIFCGSFNPVHNMHLALASNLIKQNYVDKIIFVPAGGDYKFKSNIIPFKYRYEMLQIVCNKYPNILVSDIEGNGKSLFTIDVLNKFKKQYMQDEIIFICGADNLSYIDKWHNGYDILKNYKIIVIERDGNKKKDLLTKYHDYKNNITFANIKKNNISSTYIRENINNKDITKYIDKDILKYIKDNKLYER